MAQTHHWETITLGRICVVCKLVQAAGEFDDSVPCIERKPPNPRKR